MYLAHLTGKINSDAPQTFVISMYTDANKNILGYLLWWKVKLISYGCCDRLLHIGWLKTTGKQVLTVVEARSLKSRHSQGCAPSEGSREEFFLASSEPQGVSVWRHRLGAALLSFPPLRVHAQPSPLCVVSRDHFIRTPDIGFRAHPVQYLGETLS